MAQRFAYLTGRSYRGTPIAPGDVPPAEVDDLALLRAACAERNIAFDVVYWDDLELPSRGYEFAVVRTCWDYHERPEQFISCLEAHERNGLRVFNAPSIVRWNARKTYLRDLGDAAIETVWADRVDATVVEQAFETLGADQLVVKPQVGGGSIETVRLSRGAWREADLKNGPRGAGMIQAYLPSIETEGERSLFWFGGELSHAIRKVPLAGDWLANIPGKTTFVSDVPPREALGVAEAARSRVPGELLYVRIDLVLGNDGAWRVIEIEAIEPYFFLAFAPEGARAFAGALTRVFAG